MGQPLRCEIKRSGTKQVRACSRFSGLDVVRVAGEGFQKAGEKPTQGAGKYLDGCSGNAFRERSTQSQASRPCTLNWTLLQDAFLAAQGIQEPVGKSTRQRQHSRHAACGGELPRYAWVSASKQLCEVQRAGASRLKTTVAHRLVLKLPPHEIVSNLVQQPWRIARF